MTTGLPRAVGALLRRDFQEHLTYKASFALELAAMLGHALTFYFVAQLVPGGGYFPFVLTGLAFANYHRAALSGLSMALHREQESGTLELIWMTPAGLKGVLAAGWVEEFVWASFRAAVYLAVGLCAGSRPPSPGAAAGAALVLLLTMAALSGLGLLSAAYLLVFKRGDPVGQLLDGAARLLSGVYFPVALMPAALRGASKLLPLTFGLDAFRRALLDGAALSSMKGDLLALSAWAGLGLPVGLWAFRAAVARARREGSLALR